MLLITPLKQSLNGPAALMTQNIHSILLVDRLAPAMSMYFFSLMDNATRLLPAVQNVVVPHGLPCHVIVYDFVPQLLRLLQNPDIMIQANLLINFLKPLDKFDSPHDG
jgi:hypothetical protein